MTMTEEAPPVETAAPTTFTVPSLELKRLVANSVLFACTDEDRPSLCCVLIRIDWADDMATVVLQSTDTYAMLEQRVTWGGRSGGSPEGNFRIVAHRSSLESAGRLCAKDVDVQITIDGETLVLTIGICTIRLEGEGEYPNIDGLLEGNAGKSSITDVLCLSPTLLVRCSKVVPSPGFPTDGAYGALRLLANGHKATTVKWADPSLTALVMPVRIS